MELAASRSRRIWPPSAEGASVDDLTRTIEAWTELFSAYGEAMAQGLGPESDEVRALALKSKALIAEFTGGDPGIAASLGNMYRSEGVRTCWEASAWTCPPGCGSTWARPNQRSPTTANAAGGTRR